MRGPILIFLATSMVLGLALRVSQWSRLKDTAHMVCGLVQQKYFDAKKVDGSWMRECLSVTQGFRIWQVQRSILDDLQRRLDRLETSHLQIYTPAEDLSMWTGATAETGLRVRMFESGAVVYKVLNGSPAADADIRVGDLLIQIGDNPVFSVQQVQTAKGEYLFRRGKNHILRVAIHPRVMVEDQRPSLTSLSDKIGLLRIPSFRAELFPAADWKKMVGDMAKFRRLVVDVRENSGGNFVAMLRALSPFFCKATPVGDLVSRHREGERVQFADDLRDEYQLGVLDSRGHVRLETFSGYGCVTAPLTVLTDGGTASVSEIFTAVLRSQRDAIHLGGATAGDVVVGVWYALPLLGRGFSLSIPEAVYMDPEGELLEGKGVWPHRTLYYTEEDALSGKDTWVEYASRSGN